MRTNEERRDVASKLRELVKFSDSGVCHATNICNALGLIDINRYAPSEYYSVDGVMHLADLIEPDPERKAKATPFAVEEDTGFFDTTKCECGYLNDVSATYCGQCGCVIEVVDE